MESIALSRDPRLRGEQKSEAERFEGRGFEVRLQQVRENLQGDHVSEPSQTARVRCHTLRSLPDMRSKIQASFRVELAHRRVPEKIAAHHTEKRRLACIHRGTGVRISSFHEIYVYARCDRCAESIFFFILETFEFAIVRVFLILSVKFLFFFIFLYFAALSRCCTLFAVSLRIINPYVLECVLDF